VAIDHRETAPSALRSDAFLDHGAEIPFDDAVRSGLSVGVPGTVRGWELALDRFGTRSLAEVLAPAIDIVERGFPVRPLFSRFIDYNAGKFAAFPAAARLYLDGGRPLAPGTHFANPDLARAYRELAQRGARAFYEGPIADAIVAAVTSPDTAAGSTRVRPG